jgi:hypothetical protein
MTITTDLIHSHEIIYEVLQAHRERIGDSYPMWVAHSYRMLNLCANACPDEPLDKFAIAIAFHDLPAAMDGDLRYLDRAAAMAGDWLVANNRTQWTDQVRAMIVNHHKVRPYRGPWAASVEAVRRADWVDVGAAFAGLRSWPAGHDKQLVVRINTELPVAPHRAVALRLIGRYARRHPLAPLPMMRW